MKNNIRGFFNCGAGTFLLLGLLGMSIAEDDAFEKLILSASQHHKLAIATVVDATGDNLEKVKDSIKVKDYPFDGPVWLGVLGDPAYEHPVGVENLHDLTRRIQSIRPEDVANVTSDIYGYLLELIFSMPSDSCIILITARMFPEDPLRRAFFEKLHEKRNKVFVVWTGDLPYDEDAFQSISEASTGSVVFIRGASVPDDFEDEISYPSREESSDYENVAGREEIRPRVYDENFESSESRAQLVAKRLGEVASLDDEEEEEKEFDWEEDSNVKLSKVKFPEDEPEKADNKSAILNPLSANATMARQSSKSFVFIPLRVEVSSETNLECLLNTDNSIVYDVKNNLPISTILTFDAQAQNVRVVSVEPRRATLHPTNSVKVNVLVQPLATTQDGSEGLLDFAATTVDNKRTVRVTILRFTNKLTADSTSPSMKYSYVGSCKDHDTPDTCEGGEWKIEATFQDTGSGLKKVLSEPFGLVFKEKFHAGTLSPVSVYYMASCCQPKIDIWAEDGKGNYVQRSFDVNNQGLQSGEIAAISVGVVLLIFIVIAAIVAVMLVRRRNQRKLIIPRYQGST